MNQRHQILADHEFWLRLEYAGSQWLETSADKELRRFWIDDFLPDNATNTQYGLAVEGTAWLGEGGRNQFPYHFIVSLPQKLLHQHNPPFEIETLSLDQRREVLEIVVNHRKPPANDNT